MCTHNLIHCRGVEGDVNRNELISLAKAFRAGKLPLEEFVTQLETPPQASPHAAAAANATSPASARLAAATVDLDRQRRCGVSEVVFGQGKSTASLEAIFQALLDAGQGVFATRIDPDKAAVLQAKFPQQAYNAVAGTLRIDAPATQAVAESARPIAPVALVSAGTSDLPVAEEARETLAWLEVPTRVVHDVGVAGPHRLAERLDELAGVAAVIVVAGMEGALPSVVGGHVAVPVIAVPTSVGYGASFGGLAALLGMLNSCAANVTVVNIDAGFKAGYIAGLIARGSSAV